MPKLRTMSAGLTLFVSWLICSFVGMESRSPSLSCPSGQFFLKNQCVLCHPSCAECHGHELFECTACALDEYGKERFLYQGHCRLHCPREFYPDRGQFTCLPCSSNCEICADTRVCAKCREGYRLQSGICLAARCGDGQVQDPDTGECIDCGFGCKTCSTEDSELCSSCSNGYFLSRQQCRKHCPQRTYADEARGLCISCSEPCVDCRSQSLCLTCQTGHFLYNGSCVSQCPVGSYIDSSDRLCQACHSSCESCRGSGPRDCIRCRGSIRPNNGRCPLMRCPSGHFLDVNSGQCRLCAGSCAACFGPAPQNCLSCATGFLLELQSECVESCPLGFYGNESSLVCERCSVNCEACESRDECVSCNTHSYQLYLFQGSCWSQCPDGYFETELGTCEPCEELCLTCDGTSTQCLSCRQGLHLANGQCRQSCASMSYVAEDGTCRRCAPHCDTCRDFTTCTKCSFLYLLLNGECKAVCPQGYFEDLDQGICVSCHSTCATCSGPLSDDCEACSALTPKLYEGSCMEECPAGTYYQSTDKECQECHQTCARCDGPEPTQCLKCEKGLVLDPNTMMCGVTGDSDCPPKTFLQNNQFTCLACHQLCQSCEGPGPFDCQTCAMPYYLYNDSCVSQCPSGTYSAHEEADGVELGFCMPCDQVCTTCTGASPRDCLICAPGYLHLLSHLCVSHCPTGYYSSGDRCEKCDPSCEQCTGPGPDACTVCTPPLFNLQGTRQCVEQCPERFFESGHSCRQCHTSCKSCTDKTPQGCLSCDWGSILQDGVCYPRCEESRYYSQDSECEACDESCKHCSGAGPHSCLTCRPGFALHAIDGECLPCCQPGQRDENCCLCDSGTALCLEAPAAKTNQDEVILRSKAVQHASAALPVALLLAVVLTLVVFALVQARAKKRLCWRRSYERLSGVAREQPSPRPMPHGVPEPEDSGDEVDVVYTSRHGSVYRRYGFIHEPDTEEEQDEEDVSEDTQLNKT